MLYYTIGDHRRKSNSLELGQSLGISPQNSTVFFFLFPFPGNFTPRRRVAANVLRSQRKDYDTPLTQTKFGKMTPEIIFQFLEAAPQTQIVDFSGLPKIFLPQAFIS